MSWLRKSLHNITVRKRGDKMKMKKNKFISVVAILIFVLLLTIAGLLGLYCKKWGGWIVIKVRDILPLIYTNDIRLLDKDECEICLIYQGQCIWITFWWFLKSRGNQYVDGRMHYRYYKYSDRNRELLRVTSGAFSLCTRKLQLLL